MSAQPDTPPRADRRVWLRLWARVRPWRRTVTLAVLASVVGAAAASVWASLMGPLAEGVLKGSAVTWGPLTLTRADLVARLPLALVAVALVKGLANWLHAGLMAKVGQGVLGQLRRDLYARLLGLPPAWYETRHSGDLLSRFTSDVTQVEFSVSQALSTVAKDSLQVLGLLVVCFVIDWKLFFLVFVVIPGAVIPVQRFSKAAKRTATRGQASLGALSRLTAEQLHALPVVQGYGLEGAALAQFDAEQSRYLAVMRRSLFIRGAFSPVTEFLGLIGVSAAVVFGARMALADPAFSGRLVSFLAAALLLYQPLKALSNTAQQVSAGAGAATRLFEVLDAATPEDTGAPAGPLRVGLEVSGLRLVWPDGREALKGVDFEVKAGELVALVGPSGAGKSSLLSVLLGFTPPAAGEVRWDGAPLHTLSTRSLRGHMAWVPQEPVLLSGTVRDNLRLGRADADDEALWRALGQAHAADFVRALPGGLDEAMGERGARLSGGQRQRLAIARAFLMEPSLLLLDEPTSALDSGSEAEVQAGLAQLMEGRTTLVVAHRLSTVRRAQRIVVLRDGVVAEEGTHESLQRLGGLYTRLVEASRGDALA